MSNLDILVLSGLAVALCYPAILSSISAASSVAAWFASPKAEATQERWRQRWTHTLIELLADLDRDGMKQGGILCRELMWEIIGGDQVGGKK
jgi:hypothetical protein